MKTFLPSLLRLVTAAALVACLAPGVCAPAATGESARGSARAPAAPEATVAARAAMSAPPARSTSGLGFVANRGQWAADVLFMTPIQGGRAWVTTNGIVYDFAKPAKRQQGQGRAEPAMPRQLDARKPGAAPQAERVQGHVVRLDFAGARQPAVRPKGKLKTRLNYLQGGDASRHVTNVAAYTAVSLEGLWPGVDLRLAQGPAGLSLSFSAVDAAALAKARVVVDGASLLEGRGDGALVTTSLGQRSLGAVAVALGSARHAGRLTGDAVALAPRRPVQQAVEARAAAAGEAGGGLVYSTFFGGAGQDDCYALAVDAGGASYITGSTSSADFPTTPGAYDRSRAGKYDAFVAKLSADGSALVYATFLGGIYYDEGNAVAVDASGAAYLMGLTASSDFPTTPGAFGTTKGYGYDTFVAKLAADGSALVYSTFLGGNGSDYAYGLVVDASGAAFVTGLTGSLDFPTTPGAYDTSPNGGSDAFMTKLSADGSALVYSTLLGGNASDDSYALAVDAGGAAYVAGTTSSLDFPTTPGAFDATHNGNVTDVFVAKLSADGAALVYSSYLGGSDLDHGHALAVDASGAAYVAGQTQSSNFPTTPGAYSPTHNGSYDVFVTKLAADGSALVYSSFLGGTQPDYGNALAVDASGAAYAAGRTFSPDFPTTPGAFDTVYSDSSDAFVTKLSADGSALAYATFLGGGSDDAGAALAVDAGGAVYVAGQTQSGAFPTTPGAYDTTRNGMYDAFVTQLAVSGVVLSATASPTTVAAGGSFTVDYTVSNGTDDAVTGDLGFTAVRGGNVVGQGRIRSDITVAAHGATTGSFTQRVPSEAAPGVYSYTVRIGRGPQRIKDKVAFKITVTGAARAGGGASTWEVVLP